MRNIRVGVSDCYATIARGARRDLCAAAARRKAPEMGLVGVAKIETCTISAVFAGMPSWQGRFGAAKTRAKSRQLGADGGKRSAGWILSG